MADGNAGHALVAAAWAARHGQQGGSPILQRDAVACSARIRVGAQTARGDRLTRPEPKGRIRVSAHRRHSPFAATRPAAGHPSPGQAGSSRVPEEAGQQGPLGRPEPLRRRTPRRRLPALPPPPPHRRLRRSVTGRRWMAGCLARLRRAGPGRCCALGGRAGRDRLPTWPFADRRCLAWGEGGQGGRDKVKGRRPGGRGPWAGQARPRWAAGLRGWTTKGHRLSDGWIEGNALGVAGG